MGPRYCAQCGQVIDDDAQGDEPQEIDDDEDQDDDDDDG